MSFSSSTNYQYFLNAFLPLFWVYGRHCNQITVDAFQPVQLAQASFLQKNQTLLLTLAASLNCGTLNDTTLIRLLREECRNDISWWCQNRMKQSTLKTPIFASYWNSGPSQRYRYQKNILQHLIFCKNEASVNCGTLNATTLIWLLLDEQEKI